LRANGENNFPSIGLAELAERAFISQLSALALGVGRDLGDPTLGGWLR
jgi:hypothetical protein